LGNPLRVILTAGQMADIEQASALIQDQPAEFIVADKGYDSDAFVQTITAQGRQAVKPPRSNRLTPRAIDRHIYKSRGLIERFYNRIKQFRRIATRYDKLPSSLLSFVLAVLRPSGLRLRLARLND
jgi:transposase